MSDENTIYYNGIRYVKDGQKSAPLNLSNIEYIPYSTWRTMTDAQKAETGVVIVEGYPEDGESVSVTADGVKTWATLLNELQALVDYSKITPSTLIETLDGSGNKNQYRIVSYVPSITRLLFSRDRVWIPSTRIYDSSTISLESNGSHYYSFYYEGSFNYGDTDNSVVQNGMVITLYYGSAGFDASNIATADEIAYGDGTVADSLDCKPYAFTASDHTDDAFKDVTVTLDNIQVKRCGKVLNISVCFRLSAQVTLAAWESVPIVDITNWDGGNIAWSNGAKLFNAANGDYCGALNVYNNGQICVVATSSAITLPTNNNRIMGQLTYIFS